MMELIIKMAACLLLALALGFLLGWLLSKALGSERYLRKLQQRDKNILALEEQCHSEKLAVEKSKDDNYILKKMLYEKNKLLESLRKKNNVSSEYSPIELEKLCEKSNRELEDLEMVVVKAEETIESKEEQLKEEEKRNKQLSEKLDLIVVEKEKIEKELKLYTTGKDADEDFIISKDQFIHIEEQLAQYQKEIEQLKKENDVLQIKKNDAQEIIEGMMEKGLTSEADDASIVKIFKDTYKKIKH